MTTPDPEAVLAIVERYAAVHARELMAYDDDALEWERQFARRAVIVLDELMRLGAREETLFGSGVCYMQEMMRAWNEAKRANASAH